MSVVYRLARKAGWNTRYFFDGEGMKHDDMLYLAQKLYMGNGPRMLDEWLVIGATNHARLEWMLNRINAGKPGIGCSLPKFLQGTLREHLIPDLEAEIMRAEERETPTHFFTPEEDLAALEYITRATKTSLARLFGEDPTPIPTVEEEAVNPDHAGKRWSWNWTGAERNRLNFFKWLVEAGRLEGDTHSEDTVEA